VSRRLFLRRLAGAGAGLYVLDGPPPTSRQSGASG